MPVFALCQVQQYQSFMPQLFFLLPCTSPDRRKRRRKNSRSAKSMRPFSSSSSLFCAALFGPPHPFSVIHLARNDDNKKYRPPPPEIFFSCSFLQPSPILAPSSIAEREVQIRHASSLLRASSFPIIGGKHRKAEEAGGLSLFWLWKLLRYLCFSSWGRRRQESFRAAAGKIFRILISFSLEFSSSSFSIIFLELVGGGKFSNAGILGDD